MKATTKTRGTEVAPDLADLIGDRRVVDIASRARVGAATLYRAMKGGMPHTPQVLAIAAVLGVSEGALRCAIERSRSGGA